MTPPSPLHVAMVVEQLWQPVPGGSGTYITELVRALADRSDTRLTAVQARHPGPAPGLPPAVPTVSSPLPRQALYAAWSRARLPRVRAAGGRRPDVVHATTWAVPPRGAPLVVTVHDLAFLRDPGHFTAHGVAYFTRALEHTRRHADVVVVPSVTTRVDCVEAGIDDARVRVVPHGVRVLPVDDGDVAAFRARHGLTRDLLLWCGTLEPRKNLPAVLAAYEWLLADGSDLDLVVVGPDGWGETAQDLRRTVDRLPPGRVHVLGRLDERDLHVAYAAARVFCFPSLWEGFGMPVLEAMAHGTPVVTSAGTPMAEFVGSGGLLVDPRDPESIAAAVTRAATAEHDALADGALRAARDHTWERSAELHRAAYGAATARA